MVWRITVTILHYMNDIHLYPDLLILTRITVRGSVIKKLAIPAFGMLHMLVEQSPP